MGMFVKFTSPPPMFNMSTFLFFLDGLHQMIMTKCVCAVNPCVALAGKEEHSLIQVVYLRSSVSLKLKCAWLFFIFLFQVWFQKGKQPLALLWCLTNHFCYLLLIKVFIVLTITWFSLLLQAEVGVWGCFRGFGVFGGSDRQCFWLKSGGFWQCKVW